MITKEKNMKIDMGKEKIERINNFFGFIPKHLKIKDRPELYLFSLNFLMARRVIRDGRAVIAMVRYEPDLSSFKIIESPKKLVMNYYNVNDRRARLLMTIDVDNKKRKCIKYFEEKEVGTAFGALLDNVDNSWINFFMHVGLLGITEDEVCEFIEADGKQKNG